MANSNVLQLPNDVLRHVLSFVGAKRSLPFALTSKASRALVREVQRATVKFGQNTFTSTTSSTDMTETSKEGSDFGVDGIFTYKSCFLQSDELCEYGRDVMGMDMTNKEMINIAVELGMINAVKWLRSQDPPCDWDEIASHRAATLKSSNPNHQGRHSEDDS